MMMSSGKKQKLLWGISASSAIFLWKIVACYGLYFSLKPTYEFESPKKSNLFFYKENRSEDWKMAGNGFVGLQTCQKYRKN
jgi:hypothetical protein